MNRSIRQTLFPILAALIWGLAFSAQSVVTDYMGPLTFNFARFVAAFLFLFLLDLAASRLIPGRRSVLRLAREEWKRLAAAGAVCGLALCLGSNLQQLGLDGTSAGKAGFITAMYIVIVPLFGLFRGKRPTLLLWLSVAIAVAGLYFLCVTEGFSIVPSDFYVFLCALCFAVHIIAVDHFSAQVDGIHISCAQFLVAAILSGLGMLLAEQPTAQSFAVCLGPILYTGVVSGGIGYTLQILAQKDANPTVVSLLLSLESVFAALGGALLLHERMSVRELLGCGLMLVAVLLAQLPAASGAPAKVEEKQEKGL